MSVGVGRARQWALYGSSPRSKSYVATPSVDRLTNDGDARQTARLFVEPLRIDARLVSVERVADEQMILRGDRRPSSSSHCSRRAPRAKKVRAISS